MSDTLRSGRLSYRRFEERDLPKLRDLDTDPDVVRYLGHGLVRTPEESRATLDRIFKHYAEHGWGLFATELSETGEFVGRTGLIPWELDGTVVWEVGYTLAKPFWGQGLATEAASFWKCYGFQTLMA